MELLDPNQFPFLTEKDCIQIQQKLAEYVEEQDTFEKIRTVAGVDIAYWQAGGTEQAVCCIVVIRADNHAAIETEYSAGEIKFPYIPGCFAFRELPLVLEAAEKLKCRPDLYLFDGNGILHPRKMGLASHASFYLDAPTAGIAKHCFRLEGAVYTEPDSAAGAYTDIIKDGYVLGRIVRTHSNVKPVYVSVGNRIAIETLTSLALQLTEKESRIPIPTRLADLETHRRRRELCQV
ncbi:MAG: endonuclease V [Oscillospiraceae bacterium]|nr:endonuclease V [Oscillospiraceae bacterium]